MAQSKENVSYIVIRAEEDLFNVENIQRIFSEIDIVLQEEPESHICIDLSRVPMAGTIFMNALVRLAKKHPMRYRQVELYDPGENVASIMKTVGLTKLFRITTIPEPEIII